jgi:hypothetical protein
VRLSKIILLGLTFILFAFSEGTVNAAITYVGGKGAGTAGPGGGSITLTTGLTGGSGGAPLENDLVVVTVSVGSANRTPTISISTPANYTCLTAQRTSSTTYDTNVQTCYKLMGSTPDTAVTIPASGSNQDGISYTIQVFRGVDTATPMDVTATYAVDQATDNLPDPASIQPVTSGAWIVVCGGGAAGAGGTYTAGYLTNFLTYNGPDTNDGNVGSGYYTGWTSGSYDPAKFGGGSVNAANSWGATTIALRPQATDVSQVGDIGGLGSPLSTMTPGYTYAGDIGGLGSPLSTMVPGYAQIGDVGALATFESTMGATAISPPISYFGKTSSIGSDAYLLVDGRQSANTANTTFTCPGTGNEDIVELSAYLQTYQGSPLVRLAVYDLSGNLMAQGNAAFTPTVTFGWQGHIGAANITQINPLVGGQNYKLAITSSGDGSNFIAIKYSVGAAGDWKYDSADYTGGFPSAYNPASNQSQLLSVRAGVSSAETLGAVWLPAASFSAGNGVMGDIGGVGNLAAVIATDEGGSSASQTGDIGILESPAASFSAGYNVAGDIGSIGLPLSSYTLGIAQVGDIGVLGLPASVVAMSQIQTGNIGALGNFESAMTQQGLTDQSQTGDIGAIVTCESGWCKGAPETLGGLASFGSVFQTGVEQSQAGNIGTVGTCEAGWCKGAPETLGGLGSFASGESRTAGSTMAHTGNLGAVMSPVLTHWCFGAPEAFGGIGSLASGECRAQTVILGGLGNFGSTMQIATQTIYYHTGNIGMIGTPTSTLVPDAKLIGNIGGLGSLASVLSDSGTFIHAGSIGSVGALQSTIKETAYITGNIGALGNTESTMSASVVHSAYIGMEGNFDSSLAWAGEPDISHTGTFGLVGNLSSLNIQTVEKTGDIGSLGAFISPQIATMIHTSEIGAVASPESSITVSTSKLGEIGVLANFASNILLSQSLLGNVGFIGAPASDMVQHMVVAGNIGAIGEVESRSFRTGAFKPAWAPRTEVVQ